MWAAGTVAAAAVSQNIKANRFALREFVLAPKLAGC